VVRTVLVVEDDAVLRALLREILQGRGHAVVEAADLATARHALATADLDMVLLDQRLPDGDGRTLLSGRGTGAPPVIMLTVTDDQDVKVAALEAGADDYVVKPFDPEELLARIAAVWRRVDPALTDLQRFGDVEVDLRRRVVTRGGEQIRLTRTELDLLEVFVRHPGRLLTHAEVLRAVWGPGYETEGNYVRLYVAQLRRKLGDDATAPRFIANEPGIGYRWIAAV